MSRKRISIIGGGFSGCSAAVQLCDRAQVPLDISIIEPRPHLGTGVAYSVEDNDHRLNGPTFIHFLQPDNPSAFHDWYLASGGLERDPAAEAPSGGLFVRRRELGRYISETMTAYAASNPSNSSIKHLKDRAAEINQTKDRYELTTVGGEKVPADLIIVATGNQNPSAPRPFNEGLASHPAFFESPWNLNEIATIGADAKIMIIGVGLTMADIVATLIRQGHQGSILALSRHGLLPQTQAIPPKDAPPPRPFDQIMAPKPDHLSGSLKEIVANVRRRITEDIENGGTWHTAFDQVRDAVWQVWPKLTVADKQRFLRHLRRWYDTHRFRLPPQTEKILADAKASGFLKYQTARIVSAADAGETIAVQMQDKASSKLVEQQFDAVINCTGPSEFPGDPRGHAKTNSPNQIYQSILDHGLAVPHPTKIGFDVDENCRAIRNDGTLNETMFVVGPPTLGAFGDPLGSPFIAAQIWRTIPTILETLSTE